MLAFCTGVVAFMMAPLAVQHSTPGASAHCCRRSDVTLGTEATADEMAEADAARVTLAEAEHTARVLNLDSAFEMFHALDAAFTAFDLDGDGLITLDEIGAVLREAGAEPSEAELEALLQSVDNDENGVVDFDEFCELMTMQHGSDTVGSMIEAARDKVARSGDATMCAADEGLQQGGVLRQTGNDNGMAKTDAVEQLGAQLNAQSAVRARQQQTAAYRGVVELRARPGCANGERVRTALAGLGISGERLNDVASGGDDPEVYVDGERVGNFWVEMGSGQLVRRLQRE